MENNDILNKHLDEFRKIVDSIVSDKLDYLGYHLWDSRYEYLHWNIMSNCHIKKDILQTDILRELKTISDKYIDTLRSETRFDFNIEKLREEGYQPRFFDSKYIDFIAYQGKLDNTDIEYTFNLPEPPENFKNSEHFNRKDWDDFMERDWNRHIYSISHENGECIVILREGCIDNEVLRAHPWMKGITFTKMDETGVIDFFDRNEDVPVKYKF